MVGAVAIRIRVMQTLTYDATQVPEHRNSLCSEMSTRFTECWEWVRRRPKLIATQ
jgi:hypothetical protein